MARHSVLPGPLLLLLQPLWIVLSSWHYFLRPLYDLETISSSMGQQTLQLRMRN